MNKNEEVKRMKCQECNNEKEELIKWIKNPNRKPSAFAFTAGNLRDIAFEIELIFK